VRTVDRSNGLIFEACGVDVVEVNEFECANRQGTLSRRATTRLATEAGPSILARMASFLETLMKRRVVQVVAAYAVVAWGAVQVVVTVAPELGLPPWAGRSAIVMALAGLPVAVAVAWVYDLPDAAARKWRMAVAVTALVLLSTVAVLTFGRGDRALTGEELETVLTRALELETEDRFREAYDVLDASGALPASDERVASLLERITTGVEVRSEPPGAAVFLSAWSPESADPAAGERFIGTTPLEGVRLPWGPHYVRLELDGFWPAERPLDTYDPTGIGLGPGEALVLSVPLVPASAGRDEMVAVSGGSYTLASADVPLGLTAVLDDFLIDRFEVSNAEYADFVRAGGYTDPRWWPTPLVTGDDTLSFEDAMVRFVDRSGLAGPRFWSGQQVPAGLEDHPVVGVSWYEAAAYAAFRGKQLPTVYQWEKAARDGRYALGDAYVLPWGQSAAGTGSTLANFGSQGTVPGGALPFGVSPYGAHHMAGNVSEWLLNRAGEGRAVTGGSWAGPPYTFSEVSGFDPFFASETLGFRLVYLEGDRQRLSRDQGAEPLDLSLHVPEYQPPDAAEADMLRAWFDYDPVDLEPVRTGRIDEGVWIREDWAVQGPFGERIPVFVYLPKATLPPYQTLLYVPSGAALAGFTVPEDTEWTMGPVIRSGRAVVALAMKGMMGNEHPPDWEPPDPPSVRFRDELVRNAVEMRVAIDYLATRDDIDMERLGYSAFSFGAGSRGSFLAADGRFSLAVLHGAGIDERVRPVRPEVDPVTYAPYYELPILLVQGRHDEEHPYYTRFLPLYELLPQEHVTLLLVDGGGHLVGPDERLPVITQFLDEHWGPVER
jgi:eukaryotic-like serine/threonine-protein kinase